MQRFFRCKCHGFKFIAMGNRLVCFFVLLSIMLLGANCSKQFDKANTGVGLFGTWQWVRTDGGIAFHIHETPASTGENIDMRFSADRKYYIYTNGSLTSEGTYQLETRKCIHDHKDKTVINFSSPSDYDFMIEKLDQEKLELSDEAYDGIGSLYKRKN
jgi:hypothetical protein